MPSLRVRTGCQTCRKRKKKCDERRPLCRGCERNKLECQWPSPNDTDRRRSRQCPAAPCERSPAAARSSVDYQSASTQSRWTSNSPISMFILPSPGVEDTLPTKDALNAGPETIIVQPISPSDTASTPFVGIESPSQDFNIFDDVPPSPLSTSGLMTSNLANIRADDFGFTETLGEDNTIVENAHDDLFEAPNVSQVSDILSPQPLTTLGSIMRGPSLLPGLHDGSFDLLSHYLAVTSKCMDNGLKSENSFIVDLVPMAFTSDLILHLLLTHSAVHRAAKCIPESQNLASVHYNQSLNLLRQNVQRYHEGKPTDTLALATGALIMCFVECANGDINGTVFDHLIAARWLLPMALSKARSGDAVPLKLQDFLVEYYVYASTLSSISIDQGASQRSLLPEEIEKHGQALVARGYVGGLCGCWLELLLLIPSIVYFARRFLSRDTNGTRAPNADDMILFSKINSQIRAWAPDPSVSKEYALAGRIFQQAILIYLQTALHPLCPDEFGSYNSELQLAISRTLECLEELPPLARVNTNLCWPIAVVGSCVVDAKQRDFVRSRLDTMFASLGLGNIHQASLLMDMIWESPNPNPWSICSVMHEQQIWISFA